jgi:8-oxo-dGTP pyrophosphatase MutT (NUDIX family)
MQLCKRICCQCGQFPLRHKECPNTRNLLLPETVGAYVVALNPKTNRFYVLVHRRSKKIKHGGTVCCPGGHIDTIRTRSGERVREDALTAALRELGEEAGLRLSRRTCVLSLSPIHANFLWITRGFPPIAGPSNRHTWEIEPTGRIFDDLPGAFVMPREKHCWAPLDELIPWLAKHPELRYEGSFKVFRKLARVLNLKVRLE